MILKGIVFGNNNVRLGITNDANNLIQFDENNLILKSTNTTLSGSNVEILTPSFF